MSDEPVLSLSTSVACSEFSIEFPLPCVGKGFMRPSPSPLAPRRIVRQRPDHAELGVTVSPAHLHVNSTDQTRLAPSCPSGPEAERPSLSCRRSRQPPGDIGGAGSAAHGQAAGDFLQRCRRRSTRQISGLGHGPQLPPGPASTSR